MADKLQLATVFEGKATSLQYKKDIKPITVAIKGEIACVILGDRQWTLKVIDELGYLSLVPINANNGMMMLSIDKSSFGKVFDGKYACLNYFDVGTIELKRTPLGEIQFFKELMNSSNL